MTAISSPTNSASAARISFAAVGFFATSFVMAANGNVLPQIFFQRNYPDSKALLLAACLFLGTIAAMTGVVVSRRSRALWPAVVMLVVMFLAEVSLFGIDRAAAYIGLNAAAQMGANYVTNALDHAAMARITTKRRLYDGVSTVARLLGILASPAFFTRFVETSSLVMGVLACTTGAAILAIFSTASLPVVVDENAKSSADANNPLDRADRLLLTYALGIYVALYLLAANLLYLLRDVVHLEDAQRRGGTAIMIVFLFAVISSALGASFRRSNSLRPWALFAPAPILFFGAIFIAIRPGSSFVDIVIMCSAIGCSYGVFLAEIRDYASRSARDSGKTQLLTVFNNIGNISSLVAFGAMVVLALVSTKSSSTSLRALLLIGGLPLLSLPLLFLAVKARVSEEISR